jgi:hypothetical protein
MKIQGVWMKNIIDLILMLGILVLIPAKLLPQNRNYNNKIVIDSTIINPFSLDTALYGEIYELFRKVEVWNDGYDGKLVLGDLDKDSKTEIYGTNYVP